MSYYSSVYSGLQDYLHCAVLQQIFFPWQICSFILYINIEMNKPAMFKQSLLKTCANVKFHILTIRQKDSVTELFPDRGKQKNISSNNFITQLSKKFSVKYVMPKQVRWLQQMVSCTRKYKLYNNVQIVVMKSKQVFVC